MADAWWNGTSTHRLTFEFDDAAGTHAVTLAPRGDGWVAIEGEGFAADGRAERRDDGFWIEQRAARGHANGAHAALVRVVREGAVRDVFGPGMRARLVLRELLAHAGDDVEHGGHLAAPMSGTVVAVMVKAGDSVEKGAALVVLEAMKMEHTIVAPAAGRVAAVHFAAGDRVSEGADLVDLE